MCCCALTSLCREKQFTVNSTWLQPFAFRGGVQQPVESYTRLQVVRDGDDVFLHLSASNNALSPGYQVATPY